MSGEMSASKLQRIVLTLANGSHVRYWLHWNYPCEKPWVMAVEILRFNCDAAEGPTDRMVGVQAEGMERHGFTWDEHDKRYYVDRDCKADKVGQFSE